MPSESRVIMFGVTKRPKRAAQRGVNHSHVSVVSIIRKSPFVWTADVEYTYGRRSWPESVTFSTQRTREGKRAVTITDSDFPDDRAQHVVIEATVDMPTFITSFIICGRW